MEKPDIENEETKLESDKKNHKIQEKDIDYLEKISWSIIICLIITTLCELIYYLVFLQIFSAIFALLVGAGNIVLIATLSRLLGDTARSAKKNHEMLIELAKALEEKNEESIKDIRENLEAEDVEIDITTLETEDDGSIRCPVCLTKLKEDETKCPKCGFDFKNPNNDLRYMSNKPLDDECPCCFAKISPEDTECPNCGYKLK